MNKKQSDKLVAVLVEHRTEFLRLSAEEAQWVIQSPKEAIALFRWAIKNNRCEVVQNGFLRLISSQGLSIDACDGAEVLVEAKDVFSYIDPDFKNWGADERGVATVETPVFVYELIRDATYAQMFAGDVGDLCLTQAQIKNFCAKNRSCLSKEGVTLFLFRSHGEVFVANVYFHDVGALSVSVRRFGNDSVWPAGFRRRVVLPQLAV